ncbi:hypothetical protein FPQ18DRAFT_302091 [Pyronema domesticum]|nr:hypothetical protein FPQ18DRAFT_302091 [Pyronema domesticum]
MPNLPYSRYRTYLRYRTNQTEPTNPNPLPNLPPNLSTLSPNPPPNLPTQAHRTTAPTPTFQPKPPKQIPHPEKGAPYYKFDSLATDPSSEEAATYHRTHRAYPSSPPPEPTLSTEALSHSKRIPPNPENGARRGVLEYKHDTPATDSSSEEAVQNKKNDFTQARSGDLQSLFPRSLLELDEAAALRAVTYRNLPSSRAPVTTKARVCSPTSLRGDPLQPCDFGDVGGVRRSREVSEGRKESYLPANSRILPKLFEPVPELRVGQLQPQDFGDVGGVLRCEEKATWTKDDLEKSTEVSEARRKESYLQILHKLVDPPALL